MANKATNYHSELMIKHAFRQYHEIKTNFIGKCWDHRKWHNFVTQFTTWRVVTSEGVSPITTHHTFTNHNSPCDELWYKIVSFFMVLAQLNSIRQWTILSFEDFNILRKKKKRFQYCALFLISKESTIFCFTNFQQTYY